MSEARRLLLEKQSQDLHKECDKSVREVTQPGGGDGVVSGGESVVCSPMTTIVVEVAGIADGLDESRISLLCSVVGGS